MNPPNLPDPAHPTPNIQPPTPAQVPPVTPTSQLAVTSPSVAPPVTQAPPTPTTTPPPPAAPASVQPGPQPAFPLAPTGFAFQPVVTREELEAEANSRSKRKLMTTLLIVLPVGLIAVVGAYIALSSSSFFPWQKFKTITYNNNVGNSFQLSFYKSYSLDYPYGSTSGIKVLNAKSAISGLYPLEIAIIKSTQAGYAQYSNCSGPGVTNDVLTVYNKPNAEKINFCEFDQEVNLSSSGILYVGLMQSNEQYYTITIGQDINFKQALSSPSAARAAEKEISLSQYDQEITSIVSSIKAL